MKHVNKLLYVATFLYVVAYQYGYVKGWMAAADQVEGDHKKVIRRGTLRNVTQFDRSQ